MFSPLHSLLFFPRVQDLESTRHPPWLLGHREQPVEEPREITFDHKPDLFEPPE